MCLGVLKRVNTPMCALDKSPRSVFWEVLSNYPKYDVLFCHLELGVEGGEFFDGSEEGERTAATIHLPLEACLVVFSSHVGDFHH